jgi:uncharacterized protein (TIGR00645 family)
MAENGDSAPNRDSIFEKAIESIIFSSRWLMAPMYLGLIACLGILLFTFAIELITDIPYVLGLNSPRPVELEEEVILLVLTLVDLTLAGNLVLIVLFSGYENFVSKIDAASADKDRPEWMGTLDFSGLKIKLVASIVAISGIHLLKIFMDLDAVTATGEPKYTQSELLWFTIIHMAFVVSGLAFAAMDWIEAKAHKEK